MLNPEKLDLTKTTMYTVKNRHNLVRFDNMLTLEDADNILLDIPELEVLADHITEARKNNRPVIWFCGAHVVKNGLSRFLIHFIRQKWVTHLAFNGAGGIHDFELAYLGGTSEDVPTAIEDGSFGMWEETGKWMNEALQQGAVENKGYGESLAHYIDQNPYKFPNRGECIVYQAYLNNVPATYHISIGTDIIHQHPIADFQSLGKVSGEDFKIFCYSMKDLEGGVFMNMGSSVTGPEIFLKALSIVRNQGYDVKKITTANFDIIPLGEYKGSISKSHPNYYYRPRKNVINRPTSLGGTGLYIQAFHEETVPVLYKMLKERLGVKIMTSERLTELLSMIKDQPIGIVGDSCVDIYWHADMCLSDLSKETPMFPLPIIREEFSLGAAGNVALNIKDLGGDPYLLALIGEDWRGHLFKEIMDKKNLCQQYLIFDKDLITPAYCKPIRHGISSVIYEDSRLDFANRQPFSEELQDKIIQSINHMQKKCKAIIVVDQLAYSVSPPIREHLCHMAKDYPIYVDSRHYIGKFTNCIIKPNESEAFYALCLKSQKLEYSRENIEMMGRELLPNHPQGLLITAGEYGSFWFDSDQTIHSQAILSSGEIDVVGCGDNTMAAFCIFSLSDADINERMYLANLASGITLKKIGTTGSSTPEELLQKMRK